MYICTYVHISDVVHLIQIHLLGFFTYANTVEVPYTVDPLYSRHFGT